MPILPNTKNRRPFLVVGASELEQRVDIVIDTRRPGGITVAIHVTDDHDDQTPPARERNELLGCVEQLSIRSRRSRDGRGSQTMNRVDDDQPKIIRHIGEILDRTHFADEKIIAATVANDPIEPQPHG